jgi:hypothetical protein
MNNPQASQQLLQIIKGEISKQDVPDKLIIQSKKLINSFIRTFVKIYKENGNVSDKHLLEVVLALDEIIEKEYLNEEMLDDLLTNPDKILNMLNKE